MKMDKKYRKNRTVFRKKKKIIYDENLDNDEFKNNSTINNKKDDKYKKTVRKNFERKL